MRKSSILTLLIAVTIQFVSAQTTNNSQNDFSKTIAKRFSQLWYYTPQEKVYLQTDKPYYSTGEDLWFKAYLVNASTHIQNTKSMFVYVELIDKSDTVMSRVKIRKDSLGIFSGNIKLLPEWPAGKYTLRAYTSWMQNAGTDFFFSKVIYIGNRIDDRILCKPEFGTYKEGKVLVTLNFINTYGSPVADKEVKILRSWIQTGKKSNQATIDKTGKIVFEAEIDSAGISKKYIDLSIKEPGLKFRDKIYFPDFSKDFDVQFFPESGTLLNDELQTIAFKGIGGNGLSVDLEGMIFNQNNEEIAEIRSFHKGMGKFVMKTNPGDTYYAVITSKGLTKKFELPKTQVNGVGIRITNGRGRLNYSFINKTAFENKHYSLLIHTRGVVYFLRPLVESEGAIPEIVLPPGISVASVIDSVGNTYCERLVFVKPSALPVVKMLANKTTYGRRDPVVLDFNTFSADGKPFKGNFSISVTDTGNVLNDSTSDNILSYLLLSSDLKGYIEDPAAYFTDNSAVTREKLDVLMLTQGWRRFNTADYVKGKYPENNYFMEIGQTISGKVVNLFQKPAKGNDIIFLSPYKNRIVLENTDSLGRYLIQGIEFPDSTTMILKAKSKTKLVDVEIIPDNDEFPPINTFIPEDKYKNAEPPAKYFQMIKEKYYNEGGMLIVNLEEFTVKAEEKKTNDMTNFYASMADTNIDTEKLEEFPGMGILELLAMQPGIQVNGESVSIRNASGNPLFIIDGIETDQIQDVEYINSFEIENIAIFKGASTSFFGSKGGNGVVAITLKKGVITKSITPPSLIHVTPLGYQKPVEFYVPKYDVDSIRKQAKPDLRTTIYWDPKIQSDDNGSFQVKFYTADQPNNYRIILEGISNKGEICRFMGILNRKD